MRRSRPVEIGALRLGGGAPVVVEAMVKSSLSEPERLAEELDALERAGAELVRVAVPDRAAAEEFVALQERVSFALMADVHFSWGLAEALVRAGARALRVNPGNMAAGAAFERFCRAAAEADVVVRVGANSGSIGSPRRRPESMAEALSGGVLEAAGLLTRRGVTRLILGAKSRDVGVTVAANRLIAESSAAPIHVGVTATGAGEAALVKSAIGIGALLLDGVGDTIRVSMTGPSADEVRVAKAILQATGARRFGPEIVSCPTCGRCAVDLVAAVERVRAALGDAHDGLSVAVMGCGVNGPGEAADCDVGVAFGRRDAVLFKKGRMVRKVRAEDALEALLEMLRGGE